MYDTRNNQAYRVKRITNGSYDVCWMIDNLKLAGTNITINSTNSDYTGTAFNLVDAAASGSSNYDVLQIWNPGGVTACKTNPWQETNTNYNKDSTTGCGYLYNFYTATAKTAPQSVASDDATGSICPKNWHLPTSSQYDSLISALDGYPGFPPAGAWQGAFSGSFYSSFGYQGDRGLYWSRSILNSSYAYNLRFNSGDAYPDRGSYRYGSFAVRCLLPASEHL
jgi:uncharacterized protein (TIGR02145 family)